VAKAIKDGLALVGEGCVVSGLTGVAAVAIGGSTLHHTLGAAPRTVSKGNKQYSYTDWDEVRTKWSDGRLQHMAATSTVSTALLISMSAFCTTDLIR
jgi:hypothetical protein